MNWQVSFFNLGLSQLQKDAINLYNIIFTIPIIIRCGFGVALVIYGLSTHFRLPNCTVPEKSPGGSYQYLQ